MDEKVSHFFCIFCRFKCDNITDAYNHYKSHLKLSYYCVNCDHSNGVMSSADSTATRHKTASKCDQTHVTSKAEHMKQEEGMIEMWIERFLSYQNEILEKTYNELVSSMRLFAGCPVCQWLLNVCKDAAKVSDSDNMAAIRWSHNPTGSNEWRHCCSHLRYYPYECVQCEKQGRYHKKCDFSEITRHIKDNHATNLREAKCDFNSLVKHVKISKIELFIEHCSNRSKPDLIKVNSKVVNNSPTKRSRSPIKAVKVSEIISLPKRVRLSATPNKVTVNANASKQFTKIVAKPVGGTKLIIKNISSSIKPNNVISVKKNVTIKANTSNVVQNNNKIQANTVNAVNSSNNNRVRINVTKSLKTYANNKSNTNNNNNNNNNNTNSKSVDKTKTAENVKPIKFEIRFTPNNKTFSISNGNKVSPNTTSKQNQNNLITGRQIIIKNVNQSIGAKLESLSKQQSILLANNVKKNTIDSREQIQDIVEEDELEKAMNNTIEMKNVQYFCVFCDEKYDSKELAYRHYQSHVDYYPIMCLTCGEGLSDLQSFVAHHSESHKDVLKGRYKKKEQPIIDRWISSFLYSQATIIKAFPPREQCIVCDRVFTREDVAGNKPRRCTINRRIDHLHRHLCYLPYECLLCKQSGAEFFVAYFESKAHSHIKQKHPEIDDDESRWQIFQKTVSIVKLDDLIENYLSQFGITMTLERRPVKKPKNFYEQQGQQSTTTLVPIELNENSLNTDLIFNSDNDSSPNVTNISKSNSNKAFDLIVVEDSNEKMCVEEYNNNSNDNDMVVNVSPHSLIDKSIRFSTEEEDKYFCVFCSSDKYYSRTDAYSHYGEHLDYLPVVCNTCGAKFSNVDHLMNHHKSNHLNESNVDYEIIEDQILMRWVNEFLESQVDRLKSLESALQCGCCCLCPVCIKLDTNQSYDQKLCAEHNDVSFSVHLHQHLVYNPYECVICKRSGKCVRVPNLDSIAMSHIKEHKIENASMYQLCKNFPKTLVIPKLEKLIGDSVHTRRMLERKYKIENNVSHETEPSAATSSSSSSSNNNNSPSLIENNVCSNNFTPPKVAHIRMEGGRIVNLPPKTPSSSNGNNGSTAAVTVTSSSSPRIKCLHCQKYFGSRKLLKTHHIQSHPGLTIACFVPNNISIAS